MHCSKMRTTRSLTASRGIRGACVMGGHAGQGACMTGEGHAWRGGMRGRGVCVWQGDWHA